MENGNYNGEQINNGIEIAEILLLLIRKWWVLALVGIMFAAASFAYTELTSIPTYQSTGSLYVDTRQEQRTSDVDTRTVLETVELIPTYIEILKSQSYNSAISDAMDNKYDFKEIRSMIKLSQVAGTNIMNLSVNCVDETDSYLICSHAMNLASDELLRIFEGGSVKAIDMPQEEPQMIIVSSVQRAVLGLFVGVAFAAVVLVLFNMFDKRVTNNEDLIKRYRLPILGEIPKMNGLS